MDGRPISTYLIHPNHIKLLSYERRNMCSAKPYLTLHKMAAILDFLSFQYVDTWALLSKKKYILSNSDGIEIKLLLNDQGVK